MTSVKNLIPTGELVPEPALYHHIPYVSFGGIVGGGHALMSQERKQIWEGVAQMGSKVIVSVCSSYSSYFSLQI